jgi:hypothetical protein
LTIYILIFVIIAIYAIINIWKVGKINLIHVSIIIILTIFIGYRYEIGVDWVTYNLIFSEISHMALIDALVYGDPGYSFINWTVSRAGGQIWHANLICAAIFSYGLIRFCSILPQPGLALAVSVPLLVVGTAMGYTRQATSVGCIMLAYTHYRGALNWRWIAWLSLAVLFHRSAIFAFPIFATAGSNRLIVRILATGTMAAVLLYAIVIKNIGDVLSLYFESGIESSGALPRILIGALVGASFFSVNSKEILGESHGLVRNMAITMIALLPIYFVIASTTVMDRIGVLLLPFQGAVLSAVAASLRKTPAIERAFTTLVVVVYAVIFLIWLNFSTFSPYWIPYRNVYFII